MTFSRPITDACDLRSYLLDRSCREAFADALVARLDDLQNDYCLGEAALQRSALNRIAMGRSDGLSRGTFDVRWRGNSFEQHALILKLHLFVSRQASSDFSVWPTSTELDEFIALLDQGMTSQPRTLVTILPPHEA